MIRPISTHRHETDQIGIWLFLLTEVLLFGGLFLTYTVYRLNYPDVFAEASHHLDKTLATLNTAVLLASSFTIAAATHTAEIKHSRLTSILLTITVLLGIGFLAIKGVEYWQEYQEDLIPGPNFIFEGLNPQYAEMFFTLYFVMTGLHAIHLTIGILLVTALLLFSDKPHEYVEMAGLYWHLVDIVWVFLFPLLYLV